MPLSPIERMIDEATGYKGGGAAPKRVTLRCPKCKKTKSAKMDKTDPPLTAIVEIICPKCDDGDFHEPTYYDADGNYVAPSI